MLGSFFGHIVESLCQASIPDTPKVLVPGPSSKHQLTVLVGCPVMRADPLPHFYSHRHWSLIKLSAPLSYFLSHHSSFCQGDGRDEEICPVLTVCRRPERSDAQGYKTSEMGNGKSGLSRSFVQLVPWKHLNPIHICPSDGTKRDHLYTN